MPSETGENKENDAPPLKEDAEYAKYFKMLKMGMGKDQVQHALRRDGKDPAIIDLDPDKSLASQQSQQPAADDGPPLKEDPEYSKYFKMLKMGMGKEQVEHALRRDGKDPAVADFDPEKSLASQQKQQLPVDDGPPLKDDPEYSKYFKMLKMGMGKDQIEHALKRDGKDPNIASLDPEKSLKSQVGSADAAADDGPALKDDPEYSKYFKMLKMKMPIQQIEHALQRDGKDPSIASLDPEKSLKSQTGEPADKNPPLKDNPEYQKYFKMLTMGLPMGAVRNALVRDGKDPDIMDLDPNKSLESQIGGGDKDTGIPLKDDPEYAKYFKMVSMGLPPGAVRNALQRDGKDPSIMDLDPTKSVAFQMQNRGGRPSATAKKPKKRVRRKKIYWKPLDPNQIKKDSLWTMVQGTVTMDNLTFDPKEFEDLFTESADPAEQQKKKAAAESASAKKKKVVDIISGKRSMNGGIILARLKVEYAQIARVVDSM
jgi:heat shock protein HspQ